MKFSYLLVLGLLALAQKVYANADVLLLICDKSNQSKKLDLPVFSGPQEVINLIQSYKANPDLCQAKYRDSMLALETLLRSQELMNDVCSSRTFEAIRKYHIEFIHYFVPELTEYEIKQKSKLMRTNKVRSVKPIPEALRRFFISFAKQINGLCRVAIPSQLERLERELNLEHELEMVEEMRQKAKKSMRRALFADTLTRRRRHNLNLDELKLVDYRNTRLYVNVPLDNPLWTLKDVCLLRLKPLYMEVFGTIIKLNGIGYTDETFSLEMVGDQLKTKPSITRWYPIIQICELIEDVQVVNKDDMPAGFVKEDQYDDDDNDDYNHEHRVPPVEFYHGQVKFGDSMHTVSEDIIGKEVMAFDRYMKISVLERTSYLMLIRYDIKLFLNIIFGSTFARVDDFKDGVKHWLLKNGLLTKRTAVEAAVFGVMLIVIVVGFSVG